MLMTGSLMVMFINAKKKIKKNGHMLPVQRKADCNTNTSVAKTKRLC